MERNTNHNLHTTELENTLANDFANRLYALCTYYIHGTNQDKEASYLGFS